MKYITTLIILFFMGITLLPAQNQTCVIADFPFNGNANDVSGNDNHGTTLAGVSLTEDRFGNPDAAYHFNGTDGFIECTSDAFNLGTIDYTLSFWINREAYGNHYIVSKERWGDASVNRYASAILSNPQVFSDADLLFYREAQDFYSPMWNAQNGFIYEYATPIALNEWYHIVTKREDGNFTLYINGQITSTFSNGSNFDLSNDYNFRIGARYPNDGTDNGSEFFQGKIDDVKIFNCALKDQDVTNLYNELYNETSTSNDHIELVEADINVFPNPTSGKLFISNRSDINIESATIYNIAGIKLKVFDVQSNTTKEIQVNDLPSGVYFLKMGNIVKRIVVQQIKA